ncbi:MAG: hypothetical protein JWR15_4001 [Prosthecobacter sp.]|nr:hypothetical protein [Prosthecobacter sp.]
MKGSNILKLLCIFCKVFNRVFLCLLLLLGLAAFVFDRLVMAEIPRAFPVHVSIADAQLRRSIEETFQFRPFHAEVVHAVFEQEHPDLEHFLRRGVARGLVGWCVYLHESSRLDATVKGTCFFDKNAEILEGMDAACRHWLNHGIESATPDEIKVLKDQLVRSKHPAWLIYHAKHPAGEGV